MKQANVAECRAIIRKAVAETGHGWVDKFWMDRDTTKDDDGKRIVACQIVTPETVDVANKMFKKAGYSNVARCTGGGSAPEESGYRYGYTYIRVNSFIQR